MKENNKNITNELEENEIINHTVPKYIAVNQSLCSGCRQCQLSCSEYHYGVFNPKLSSIKITRDYGGSGQWITTETCRQCLNAWCMRACPMNAIRRNKDSGAVIVDEKDCIGCGVCVNECPFDMIKIHSEIKKAFKCDLCGGNASCVEACPNKALTVKPLIGFKKRSGGEKND